MLLELDSQRLGALLHSGASAALPGLQLSLLGLSMLLSGQLPQSQHLGKESSRIQSPQLPEGPPAPMLQSKEWKECSLPNPGYPW